MLKKIVTSMVMTIGTFAFVTSAHAGYQSSSNTGSGPWVSRPITQDNALSPTVATSKFRIEGDQFIVNTSDGIVSHSIKEVRDCNGANGYVQAGPECLRAYSAGGSGKNLTVVIPGDHGKGGPVKFFHDEAIHILQEMLGGRVVTLIRPGYYAEDDQYSSGNDAGRRSGSQYTPYNTDVLAAAIENLKKETGAENIYIIGHSGGATFAALIADRHPNLSEKLGLYLANCACDISSTDLRYVSDRLDPIEHTSHLGGIKIYMMTPAGDTTTPRRGAEKYATTARNSGATVDLVDSSQEKHNFSLKRNKDGILRGFTELTNN